MSHSEVYAQLRLLWDQYWDEPDPAKRRRMAVQLRFLGVAARL